MSWDWGQMFTPPKSKSPWTAMTHGSTGEWGRDLESWGPVIQAAMSKIPYVGPILGAAGGAAGMGGRGTGYIGSDYGDANYGTTIGGAIKGLYGGDIKSAIPGAIQGTISSVAGEDDQGVNPEADKYNSSWYGGLISGVGTNASRIGSNYGGSTGGQIGGQIGGMMNIFGPLSGSNGQSSGMADMTGGMGGGQLGSMYPQQSQGTPSNQYASNYQRQIEEQQYYKKIKEMIDKYLEEIRMKQQAEQSKPKVNRRLTPVEEYRLSKTFYGETPKYSFMPA